jgi:RNA polymerase sigma-70 factor (ECF subfamily)
MMSSVSAADVLLVERIQAGESDAWNELIERFEGRLLAYVDARLRDRAASEDIVQETFIGFLISLPHFDADRPLEGYLFSIAAHKLTDYLRRQARRPTLPLSPGTSSDAERDLPGSARPASSMARSAERQHLEAAALGRAMDEILTHWRKRQEWDKIKCCELLFVRGLPNKDAAARLGCSEQFVANQKFDFVSKLRIAVRQQGLSTDVFPELRTGE